ncbi:MAG: hypothetical protein U0361_16400 [Nitrospiraceae bacterium]
MPGQAGSRLGEGLASTNVRSLAQSQIDPKLFYAGTNGSGLYRSGDGGMKWLFRSRFRKNETTLEVAAGTPTESRYATVATGC